MSDGELKLKEDAPIHGVWFWKLAIFEGISSTFVVMGGAILAASAHLDRRHIQFHALVAMVFVLAWNPDFRGEKYPIIPKQNRFSSHRYS